MFFSSLPSVSVSEAAEKSAADGAILIDVRSRGEFGSGHASNAVNMPLDSFTEADLGRLKGYREVFVICQSGGRSSLATRTLRGHDINAINVSGGTSAWHAHGLPMA